MSHLTSLKLSFCRIDDAGVEIITAGLAGSIAGGGGVGNTTLQVLDISFNRITLPMLFCPLLHDFQSRHGSKDANATAFG
jgi:Leucine Rich repeat